MGVILQCELGTNDEQMLKLSCVNFCKFSLQCFC